MKFLELGSVSFREAWRLQERLVERIAAGEAEETVLLLEHPHVFTLGRTGSTDNLLANSDLEGNPVELIRINRGGDVTYHGPGQLVGYPLLDLKRRGRDVHRYLRDLEELLIRTARQFGVESGRRTGLTGVWTETGKLASIGVGVRRWITMHGFALNVCTDLRYFEMINPCGIPGCPMTSLTRLSGRTISVIETMERLKRVWSEVFQLVDGSGKSDGSDGQSDNPTIP